MKLNYQYFSIKEINSIPPVSCVYWLFDSSQGYKEIVYIGLAKDIYRRIRDHLLDKNFDYFTFVSYPRHLLAEQERRIIKDYKLSNGRLPKYNKQLG